MSDSIKINRHLSIPGWELWRTTSTSNGPGGQHANRAETRVILHWIPKDTSMVDGKTKNRMLRRLRNRLTSSGELQVSSQETRSQKRNLEDARDRMASIVKKSLKQKKRRKRTRRSRSSNERRLRKKKRRGKVKKLRKSPSIRDY